MARIGGPYIFKHLIWINALFWRHCCPFMFIISHIQEFDMLFHAIYILTYYKGK